MAKVVAGSAEGVLTKELLNKLISYNAETGLLSWKKRDGNFAHTGKPCISTDTNKQSTYKRSRVQILGVTYTTSRVVYIMHHGSIPIGKHIDHINRDPLDNRIENLRAVTRSQNLRIRCQENKQCLGIRAFSSTVQNGERSTDTRVKGFALRTFQQHMKRH